MIKFRSKVIYFLVPILLIVGSVILVGSSDPAESKDLKGLTRNATTISLDPPNDLNFAGEIVPLHDFDVQERLDKELIRYIYYHSATIMNIKRASRWKGEMTAILESNNVPEDFFYLCVAESHLSNASSPVGAKGFWQFMKPTGISYGLEVSSEVDERYDPIKSTHAACKYLKDAHRKFGNWTLVAASYNMGMGGLQKQINRQGVNNYYDLYLNKETAAYVFRILALKTVLGNPAAYGFDIREEQLYRPTSYRTVTVDTTITDLIAFAQANGTTYKMLKVMNPWLLKDKLTVGKDKDGNPKKYRIKIPRVKSVSENVEKEMLPAQDSLAEVDSTVVDSTVVVDSTEAPVGGLVPTPVENTTDSVETVEEQ